MKIEKMENLDSIISSANQIHLTIYLSNHHDLPDLKRQIRQSLAEAKESLVSVMHEDEQHALLLPIEALLEDAKVLKQIKGNIGIFRTRSAFRVLSLPVEVRRSCHVANTFHVKPLLRWMQWDSDFLLLGLKKDSAHLYLGNQVSLRKIDTLLYPNLLTQLLGTKDTLSRKKQRELKTIKGQTLALMSEWIEENAPALRPKLFLAGEDDLAAAFKHNFVYRRTVRTLLATEFSEYNVHEIARSVRLILRNEARARLEHALLTFQLADAMNIAKSSIHEIAKAAVQGKIKKLIIAENKEVFGKLDPLSGKLAIHPFDLDHEDDDLLDDLAQRVLINGGEVFVAKKEEIPNQKPILAILKDERNPAELKIDLNALKRFHILGAV